MNLVLNWVEKFPNSKGAKKFKSKYLMKKYIIFTYKKSNTNKWFTENF